MHITCNTCTNHSIHYLQIINFYFSLITQEYNKLTQRTRTYTFNTFFYPKLLKDGFSGVKRWTKQVYIIWIPIVSISIKVLWFYSGGHLWSWFDFDSSTPRCPLGFSSGWQQEVPSWVLRLLPVWWSVLSPTNSVSLQILDHRTVIWDVVQPITATTYKLKES